MIKSRNYSNADTVQWFRIEKNYSKLPLASSSKSTFRGCGWKNGPWRPNRCNLYYFRPHFTFVEKWRRFWCVRDDLYYLMIIYYLSNHLARCRNSRSLAKMNRLEVSFVFMCNSPPLNRDERPTNEGVKNKLTSCTTLCPYECVCDAKRYSST